MNDAIRRLSRNWLGVFSATLLLACIVLLYFLRSDPTFASVLGILIGASVTSLLQLGAQTREREIKLDDAQLERERQIVQSRVDRTRQHFAYVVVESLQMIKHIDQTLITMAGDDNGSSKKRLETMQQAIDSLDFRILVEGRATISSWGNPTLNDLIAKLEQSVPQFFLTDLPQSSNKEEFDRRSMRLRSELEEILGSAYAELDRVLLRSKL